MANSVCYKCEDRQYPTCYNTCERRKAEVARNELIRSERARMSAELDDIILVSVRGNHRRLKQR